MTQKKVLTTQAATSENMLAMLNREIMPVLRQVTKATVISGSRSGATVAVLQSLLTALSNAGIITDNTSP